MPELTDSYCERCGARHVFATSGSKGLSLRSARVLAKGLKNFVLNDGQSLGDSLTTARLEDESGDSSRMTEAFHKAFNFCMTCRQYACDKCWNAQVGACLSCAPQADSAPVAPEDRLIVRTPVARWDPDWLNSSDPETELATGGGAPSSAAEPLAQLHTSPIKRADEPAFSAPPTAWPTADVLRPSASTGPGGKNSRAGRKAAEPGASSLWPAADELAPEMTLTPEEMMLVEAELSHPEPAETVTAAAQLAEPPTVPMAASLAESAMVPMAASLAEPAASPMPASLAEPATMPMPAIIAETQPDSPAEVATAEALPLQPAEALEPAQALEPAEALADRPEPAEPAGMVARLFHRHATTDRQHAPRFQEAADASSEVPTQPWPHATPWSESSFAITHWWGKGTDGAADGVSRAEEAAEIPTEHLADLPVQVVSELQADLSEGPALDEITTSPRREDVAASLVPSVAALEPQEPADLGEARSAAAIRQTAITRSANRQVEEEAAAVERAAQVESAAWPEAGREVAAVEIEKPASDPAQVRQPAEATPAQASTPPVAWPPLGASWPAPNPHAGTWPGPSAPLPAVVAAQKLKAPFELELWAQSAQEVMNRGTVRVCHRCALPVSTQARFCRRCGTSQA
jgi:ribosomal protein L40E